MSEETTLTPVGVDDLIATPFLVDHVTMKLLAPLDLSEYMKVVREGIRRAYGEYCKDGYVTNTIGLIMSGRSQCWAVFAPGDPPRFVGIVLTENRRIDMLDATSLYITLLSLDDGVRLSERGFTTCLDTLKGYALEQNCDMLFAETINLDLAQVAGKLGFTCFAAILKLDLR